MASSSSIWMRFSEQTSRIVNRDFRIRFDFSFSFFSDSKTSWRRISMLSLELDFLLIYDLFIWYYLYEIQ